MHLAVKNAVNCDSGVRVQMKTFNRQLLCNAAALGMLLAIPILDATAATVVIDESNVGDSPFREPLESSNENVSGSDTVGDKQGGTSALILKLIAPTESTPAKEKLQ
jgi:hypothetical protein